MRIREKNWSQISLLEAFTSGNPLRVRRFPHPSSNKNLEMLFLFFIRRGYKKQSTRGKTSNSTRIRFGLRESNPGRWEENALPLPLDTIRGMDTRFRRSNVWDRLGGQAVVMIGRWYSRQPLTNHK